MNWFKKKYRALRNQMFSEPLVQYREVQDYHCKFCKNIFWHSFYKDICQNCIKKGIEYAIKQSEK